MASEGELASDTDDANVTKVSTRHLDFLKSRIMHYLCSKQDVSAEIYHNEGQPAQMILRFGSNQGATRLAESSIQTSNKLLVKNLPEAADKDHLQMFFEYERGQGGGPVKKVTLNKRDRFATIEFQDAKAVAAVLSKRPIKMLGATVDVDVYSPYLDDDEKLKSIELTDIPEELIKEIAELNLKQLTEPDATAPELSITNNIVEILKSDTSIIKEEESVSQSVVEKETITKEINTVTTEEPGAEKLSFTLEPGWPRVRVSPDWSGNPDRYGLVGTVISTRKKGKAKVLWDNEIQETVKFGEGGVYEVHVVNEPKLLAKNETIAVGVFVARGPEWRWENQDGGVGSIGVVTKVENGNVVHVVWPGGKLGNYRFGYRGKYDIQVCPDQKKPDHAIWEFRESSGGSWDMFPDYVIDEIESLYQTDPKMKSELTTKDTTYILDLESKKITDGKSAELPWTIRRREMTDKEYRKYADELAGLE